MANSDSERNTSGRTNLNRTRTIYLTNLLFLCAVTICSLLVTVYMFRRVRHLTRELEDAAAGNTAAEETAEETPNGNWYTDTQIEKIKADAMHSERSSILLDIQSAFESGNSTTKMLRELYPGDLVVVNNGSYYFFPVQKSLNMNGFSENDFELGENGLMTYVGEDPSVVVSRGIDISSVNGAIEWQKVAEDQVAFAMVRGAYWTPDRELTLDERFEENVSGAIGAGIRAGCYVDLEAESPEEAKEAALFLLDNLNVSAKDMGMPIAVRVQIPGQGSNISFVTKEEWTATVIAFCDAIKKAGYEPVIYANTAAFHILLNLRELEEYDKWIADYSSYLYFPYRFRCWQYSTSGSVDGIKGDVNLDISVSE
mgnify:CR=1 FL=1